MRAPEGHGHQPGEVRRVPTAAKGQSSFANPPKMTAGQERLQRTRGSSKRPRRIARKQGRYRRNCRTASRSVGDLGVAAGSTKSMSFLPHLGHGVGSSDQFIPARSGQTARADWFEVILGALHDRRRLASADIGEGPRIAAGVFMACRSIIGGTDPLREDYLAELELLIRRFAPRGFPSSLLGSSRRTLCHVSCHFPN